VSTKSFRPIPLGSEWDGERLVSKKTILLFGSGLAPIQNMTDLFGNIEEAKWNNPCEISDSNINKNALQVK